MSTKKNKEMVEFFKLLLMYQCKNLKDKGFSDEDIHKYVKGELNDEVMKSGHDQLKMLKYYDGE